VPASGDDSADDDACARLESSQVVGDSLTDATEDQCLPGWSAICLDGPASRMLDTCMPDLCSYPTPRNEANGIGYGLFRFSLRLQVLWWLRPLRHVLASGTLPCTPRLQRLGRGRVRWRGVRRDDRGSNSGPHPRDVVILRNRDHELSSEKGPIVKPHAIEE
jgi:hypothetical protein